MTRRSRPLRVALAALLALAGGCTRAAPRPAPSGACEAACSIEVENRAAHPIEVVVAEGFSVRVIGEVRGYGSEVFAIPAGISLHHIRARLVPGAGAAGRRLDCEFRNRGGSGARLTCDARDR